jgi:hypothetical protein
MTTDWIQAICAIPVAISAVIDVIIGVKSLPKISKKDRRHIKQCVIRKKNYRSARLYIS